MKLRIKMDSCFRVIAKLKSQKIINPILPLSSSLRGARNENYCIRKMGELKVI